MKIEPMSIEASKYVVLDVETNGLSSKWYDLLSISFYKPDDKKKYVRYLPLELNYSVYNHITAINGITTSDLDGLSPLSQKEVDKLFKTFELEKRIILHYGSLDEKFIKAYFKRHGLTGFDSMSFFNFKRLVCASSYSDGNLTKDNLCEAYGIKGVSRVHSGINDCKLEWELFTRMEGRPILATNDLFVTNLYMLNEKYIIPVSYLATYPNLARLVERPYIECSAEEVFRHTISGRRIKQFSTNINGITIEHLIDVMLNVKRVDPLAFNVINKGKLKYIGSIGRLDKVVPINCADDGTVVAIREEDKKLEGEINESILEIKKQISPLIAFIRDQIFTGRQILSQELVVDYSRGIMAQCDLSNQNAVLEIKTGHGTPEEYKEQLFYESAGRNSYLLNMEWNYTKDRKKLKSVDFVVTQVHLQIGEKPDYREKASKLRSEKAKNRWQTILEPKGIVVKEFGGTCGQTILQCSVCKKEWFVSYRQLGQKRDLRCPFCYPKRTFSVIMQSKQ